MIQTLLLKNISVQCTYIVLSPNYQNCVFSLSKLLLNYLNLSKKVLIFAFDTFISFMIFGESIIKQIKQFINFVSSGQPYSIVFLGQITCAQCT